jgi:serine-type D-Ala-D-Ala carboxypeptidase/endopeptidase (penicillin-binding protein 4)
MISRQNQWRQVCQWGSLSLVLQIALSAPVEAAEICPAQLEGAIAQITTAPELRQVRWGIAVQTLADSQPVYAQNAEQLLIPASNAKLLTTAAALTQLTPTFRFRTSVYQTSQTGEPLSLRILGRGDPSLTERELQQLAQQLRDRGITQIDRLILDDQYFRGNPISPTWEPEDIQQGYGAPANSLILNQNAIDLTLVPQNLGQPLRVVWENPSDRPSWRLDNQSQTVATTAPEFVEVGRDRVHPIIHIQAQLRVGSDSEPVAISVPDPVRHFGDRFRQILQVNAMTVQQTLTASDPLPPNAIEIAAVRSAPLGELIIETNRESNNLYAETLLRTLGVTGADPASADSRQAGLNTMNAVLLTLGIAPNQYSLVDGSGLSPQDRISPIALVQTLQAMARSPYAEPYRSSLAVAGINGTLKNRFQDSPVRGHLQGKTGYISGAAALSGYLQPPDFPPLGFSILVNQSNPTHPSNQAEPESQTSEQAKQAIDQIVEILFDLNRC